MPNYLPLLAGLFVTWSGQAQACPLALPTAVLAVADRSIGIEIAATPASRQCGLSARPTLAPDRGMLFVFPDAVRQPFWMHNTRVALSIAFIDDTGKILAITDMQPQSRALHHPPSPYRYALEVTQGWFQRHGIEPGDHIGVTALDIR